MGRHLKLRKFIATVVVQQVYEKVIMAYTHDEACEEALRVRIEDDASHQVDTNVSAPEVLEED